MQSRTTENIQFKSVSLTRQHNSVFLKDRKLSFVNDIQSLYDCLD